METHIRNVYRKIAARSRAGDHASRPPRLLQKRTARGLGGKVAGPQLLQVALGLGAAAVGTGSMTSRIRLVATLTAFRAPVSEAAVLTGSAGVEAVTMVAVACM